MRAGIATVQGAGVPYPYGGKNRLVMIDIDPPRLYAWGARVALAEKMAEYHRRFDLLLTPTSAEPAPRLNAPPDAGRDATPFAYPFSLTRQPAISVPCGTTRARLPIGLQIVGRPFQDGLVLAAADAVEARLGALRVPD